MCTLSRKFLAIVTLIVSGFLTAYTFQPPPQLPATTQSPPAVTKLTIPPPPWEPTTGPQLTYLGVLNMATNGGSKTFTNVNIGTAATDRLIILGAMTSQNNGHVSDITIAGNSATRIAASDEGGWQQGSLWQLLVPTGTTATIAVDASAAQNLEVSVYSLTGYDSATAVDTAEGDNSYPEVLTLATQSGGVLIACGHGGHQQSAFVVTGVDTTDTSGIDLFYDWYSGHSINTITDAAHTITLTRDPGAGQWQGSVAASWR